jgi:hypothetical protein
MFELPVLPWKTLRIFRATIGLNTERSVLDVVRLALMIDIAGASFPRRVRRLQVPPQPQVQSDGNAHHNQGAHTQDQEPPDHPHD